MVTDRYVREARREFAFHVRARYLEVERAHGIPARAGVFLYIKGRLAQLSLTELVFENSIFRQEETLARHHPPYETLSDRRVRHAVARSIRRHKGRSF